MTPLTIHLLISNNEQTLRHTLESIRDLPATILVGVLNSNDRSVAICQEYGAKIIRVSGRNRSEIRNNLMAGVEETPWHFWIEPWEFIVEGQQTIAEIVNQETPGVYRIKVFEKEVITKPTRLWSGPLRWINPVFESLTDNQAQPLPVSVWSMDHTDRERDALLESWYKNKPADLDPVYYMACARLASGKYQEFLAMADHYLFRQKKATVSATMLRYYSGLIHCYVTKDVPQALQQAIHCLAQHPLMAEFWCLVGDIHVLAHDYEKAITFYENGLILGTKRLQDDPWPINLTRYKAYPEEMIEKCRKVLENSRVLGTSVEYKENCT